MKMNRIILLLCIAISPLIITTTFAAEITGKVDLTKVTLFMHGAELQGKTVIQVPQGESELVLTNLANTINVNSINVGLNNQAMILTTSLVDNYLIKKQESDKLKSLRAALAQQQDEQATYNIRLAAINEEIALLQGNRIDAITRTSGSLNDAKQAINFIKENLVVALTEQRSIKMKLSQLEQQINQYQSQIYLEKGNDTQYQKAIKVKIYANKAESLPVNLSYITPEAGWSPIYDVRVKDIKSPLMLTYKAKVYQNSGLNWHNIDFTLSTTNPSEGITAPIPTPWNLYLDDGKSFKYNFALKTVAVSATDDRQLYAKDSDSDNFTNYVAADNNGLNIQFNIKLPYSIMGYSKDNILTLKERDINAEYHYIATPKLDSNAFLQAQINDWDKLSLLPGKSTIFYGGNYIGEGYITTQGIKDKLNISLGRDKAIIIARNQDLNETSKPSFFGSDISQKFVYTIDIRNTKDLPIDITIYDQLPVIQNKIITLEDAKYQGADYEKTTGLLTWQLNLKAKEVKQLPFSFKINYPKDKANYIIGL